mgnify:CR=1 FL=1
MPRLDFASSAAPSLGSPEPVAPVRCRAEDPDLTQAACRSGREQLRPRLTTGPQEANDAVRVDGRSAPTEHSNVARFSAITRCH